MNKFEFSHTEYIKRWDEYELFHNYIGKEGPRYGYYNKTPVVLFETGEVIVKRAASHNERGEYDHVDIFLGHTSHLSSKTKVTTPNGDKVPKAWLTANGGGFDYMIDRRTSRMYALGVKVNYGSGLSWWDVASKDHSIAEKLYPRHTGKAVARLLNKEGEWIPTHQIHMSVPSKPDKTIVALGREVGELCKKYCAVTGKNIGNNTMDYFKFEEMVRNTADPSELFSAMNDVARVKLAGGFFFGRAVRPEPYLIVG